MTVRHYSSLDTGAPVLSGNLYNRVKQVLLACLVNGYGSKPGAGWTVGHQSADGNGFSLSNGAGVINFVYAGNSTAFQIYLMESITDGTNALAEGVNRRSAGWEDGGSSSERQTIYNTGGLDSGTNPHWTVVADDKTAIIGAAGGSDAADITQAWQGFGLYFGRYINPVGLTGAAEFVALGGASSAGIGYLGMSQFGTSLRNPFTGVIEQGGDPRYGAANATYAGGKIAARYKLQPSRLLPVRCALVCYGVGLNGNAAAASLAYAGQLRGLVSEPAVCGSLMSEVCGLFGLANIWQSRVQAITLPGGKQLVPIFPNISDAGFFVSLDPDDWS